MRNFKPEVYRAHISRVENMAESEWTLVQRKIKSSLKLFLPCNKHACNSKSHTVDRCWWINPILRYNINISNEPNQGAEIETSNLNVNKVKPNQFYDHRSWMKSHYYFIMCNLSQESNLEIRIKKSKKHICLSINY